MEPNVQRQSPSPNCSFSQSVFEGSQMKYGEAEPVVIGGMVLDIHATPSVPATPSTTTPGKVLYTLGGVGRNVAECMSKLGAKPFMISAVGLDMPGKLLLEHWKSIGLSIEGIQRHHEIETPVVCNIFDAEGELAAAVASVHAIENFLTPEWIQQFKYHVCCAPVLMTDANLSSHALQASCQMAAEYDIPVWFEPVSVEKSKRVASVVKYINFASPNEDELIAMANVVSSGEVFSPIKRDGSNVKFSTEYLFRMLKPAIWMLLENGIKVIVVTLGPDGAFLCSKGKPSFGKSSIRENKPNSFGRQLYERMNSICPTDQFCIPSVLEGSSNLFAVHFPALSASVVRLTGAGDCFVGGILASICAGLDIMQSVAVGIAAAKVAVEAAANVPSEYCLTKITGSIDVQCEARCSFMVKRPCSIHGNYRVTYVCNADDAKTVYYGAKVVFCQSML